MATFKGGHWIENGNGLGLPHPGKFIKDYAPGSAEHLAVAKLDEIILAVNALISQFNAFLAHADAAAGAPLGTSNAATYSGVAVPKTASDELIQSPKLTNL